MTWSMVHKEGIGFNLTVTPSAGPGLGECARPLEARRI